MSHGRAGPPSLRSRGWQSQEGQKINTRGTGGRANARRRVVAAAIALGVAALSIAASPVAAAGCSGASHQLLLSSGTVNPASGTTSSLFTFSVVYEDNAGCAPTSVTLKV